MEKNTMIKKTKSIIYFFIIIFVLINPSQSIKYFKSFTLLSNKIVIISNDGIYLYDPSEEEEPTLVQSITSLISTESDADLELIAFAQSPSSEGGYFFCRIKTNIYIFDQNLETFYGSFEESELSGSVYCVLNPYRTSNGNLAIIISFINGDSYIRIIMYQININESNVAEAESIAAITKHLINLENNMDQKTLNTAIGSELFSSPDYTNKILICFVFEMSTSSIMGVILNPDDNLTFLYFSENGKRTGGGKNIKTAVSPVKKSILVCYMEFSTSMYCVIYDYGNNIFYDIVNLGTSCNLNSHNMGVQYISEKQEFIVFL